ncbi:transcription factor, variant [Schizosaccharomyces cryophilus OY26]|uniref:Transcription factor, variant n=1 Tax=Schizosaccharomyces cryophilus (strain OY26 / ATCC MYA-4695 / CBS 11777 / NBRC 106824 / NRRL Y48691) TaxID=653667 RepID=S9VZT4_SCHCR|nr:transcription factor, variant [Schizosaccharomyces cryophilus OY26]EPY51779.1 transcription factor, variant [Schizosaccharomyces cryophilus OY26]
MQQSSPVSILSNATQTRVNMTNQQDGQMGEETNIEDMKPNSPSLPSWVHEKTKAGKERKRLPLACQTCRKKKIKCSGERPSCDQCSKHSIPCVYKSNPRRSHSRHEEIHHHQQIHLQQQQNRAAAAAAAAANSSGSHPQEPLSEQTPLTQVGSPRDSAPPSSSSSVNLNLSKQSSSSSLNAPSSYSYMMNSRVPVGNPQVSMMSASLSKNLVLDRNDSNSASPESTSNPTSSNNIYPSEVMYVPSTANPSIPKNQSFSAGVPIADVASVLPMVSANTSNPTPAAVAAPTPLSPAVQYQPQQATTVPVTPAATSIPPPDPLPTIPPLSSSEYPLYSTYGGYSPKPQFPFFENKAGNSFASSTYPDMSNIATQPVITTNNYSLNTNSLNEKDENEREAALINAKIPEPLTSLTMPSTPVTELPPLELRIHLAEVFFHCCHGQAYNLFHRPTFFESLNSNTIPLVLVYAICAVSARFSSRMHDQYSPPYMAGEQFAREARRLALDNFDRPDLSLVAALLLLSLHDSGTGENGKSWMYGGMALRMAAALQLNCEQGSNPLDLDNIDSGPRISFLERELRRRTFWSCFLMDRCVSSHEHLQFLDENDIGIQLPVHELLFTKQIAGVTQTLDGRILEGVPSIVIPSDTTENMGVAAYIVKIIAIWGRAVKYFKHDGKRRDSHPYWHRNSDFTQISETLYQWADGLPQRLRYSVVGLENHLSIQQGAQYAFLHLAYHYTLMWLFRSVGESENNQLSRTSSTVSLTGNTISFSSVWHNSHDSHHNEFQAEQKPENHVNSAARRLHKAAREMCLRCANAISMIVDDCRKHNVILTSPFIASGVYTAFCIQTEAAFGSNVLAASTARHNLEIDLRLMLEMKNYWGSIGALCERMSEIWADWVQRTSSGSAVNDTIANEPIDEEKMLDLEKHFMYIAESPIIANHSVQETYSSDLMSHFGLSKNADWHQWNGLWPSDDLRNYQESTIDSLVGYATGNPGWNVSFAG